LRIENYKLQIEESCSGARSGHRRVSAFQFALFNFQFSISFILLPLLILFVFVSSAYAQKKSSCIECHIKLDDTRLSAPAKLFDNDIHKSRGLSCNDCHGGDPNADTKEAAKDPRKGYLGKPKTLDIPA